MATKVSVIIPIYNVEKYIKECLESVLHQTLQDIEIICVDDGCTDQSMQIAVQTICGDSRVKIIHQNNAGLSVARNVGLSASHGEYIYFVDGDDYICPDALEKLYDKCVRDNTDIVYFGATVIYESPKVKRKYKKHFEHYYHRTHRYPLVLKGTMALCLLDENNEYRASACLQILKRSFLEKTGICFYPGILHEDNLFSLQLILQANRVSIVNDNFYIRRLRNESITTAHRQIEASWGYYVSIREITHIQQSSLWDKSTVNAISNVLEKMQKDAMMAVRCLDRNEIRMSLYQAGRKNDIAEYELCVLNPIEISKSLSTWDRRITKLKKILTAGTSYYIYRRQLKHNPDKICVSIIVPVYNVEKYLPEMLESVLNQTLRNIEIICVDDGSTDNSLQILKEYQRKDNRIVLLQQKKTGAGAARNYGMSIASGEYLLFLDADDIFDVHLCSRVYYQCVRKKADICLFGAKRLNMQTMNIEPMTWVLRTREIPSKNLFSANEMKDRLFQITTGCPWSKMFKRDFVEIHQLQFQNLENTNDAFFVRMCMVNAKRITTVKRRFVTYRYKEGSNTQSRKADAPLEFYTAFKAMKEYMQEKGIYSTFEKTYCNMVLTESIFALNTVETDDAIQQIKDLLIYEAVDFWELFLHDETYFYNVNELNLIKKICGQN